MAAAAAAELPFEIITQILTYLPVKPLNRFKCVSKQLKTLISPPKFIKRHLNQTLISFPNSNQNLLISHHSLISSPISTKKFRFTELNHPLKNLPDPSVTLVDACNGLIVVYDCETQDMYLYNPGCNSHRLLPSPHKPPSFGTLSKRAKGLNQHYFGFGYDSLNDDYKIVRLLQWIVDGVDLYRETIVYSLREDSWKRVKDDTTLYFLQHMHAVNANEMLHFIAFTRESRPVFKCFDLRSDSLSIVEYPELETYDCGEFSLGLRELRGCLCLLVNYQKPKLDPNLVGVSVSDQLCNRQFLYADVWEMRERGKKESWVKLFRIQQREIIKCGMYLRHVTYSKDKRSLLLEVDGEWFGWYDLVTKRIKRVSVEGLRVGEDSHSVALTYMESLVSVNSDKLIPKGKTDPPQNIKDKKVDYLSSGFKLKL